MKTRRSFSRFQDSHGAAAVIVAIALIVLIGMTALAIDVGYVAMTKTQLQAISDAATLSGGTAIMSGLRKENTVPPATVAANGRALAIDYANNHPNGDIDVTNDGGTYVNAIADNTTGDVKFGTAIFNSAATPPRWEMFWGLQINDPSIPAALRGDIGAFNLIGTTVRRDADGSSNNDSPLPLLFANAIGSSLSRPAADSAAVVMPAKGIRIIPGGAQPANVMPFALSVHVWKKYLAAQNFLDDHSGYFPNHPNYPNSPPPPLDYVLYESGVAYSPGWTTSPYSLRSSAPATVADLGDPLFGYYEQTTGNGGGNQGIVRTVVNESGSTVNYKFVQDVWDNWSMSGCGSSSPCAPTSGRDAKAEISLFPRLLEQGNFGTIDIGSPGNSTSNLSGLIDPGVTEQNLSYYSTANGYDPPYVFPPTSMDTGGNTGISASIGTSHGSALDRSIGKCKAMFLFESIEAQGNTKVFHLLSNDNAPHAWPAGTSGMSPIVGIVVLAHRLNGNDKNIMIQSCTPTLVGGIGDIDEPITSETTVFTPLILIE